MKQILRFGLFALLLVTTGVVSSCSKDNTDNDDPIPPTATIDEKLNHWMFDYMKTHYLWNEAVQTLKPDFSVNYNDFLQNVLETVTAQDNVNRDDGHWVGGERQYFYSKIGRFKLTESQAVTRVTHETTHGTGIFHMNLINAGDYWFFELLAVSPGSPAYKAGLRRSTLISQVNGAKITAENWQESANALRPYKVGVPLQVTVARMNEDQNELIETGEVTMVSASFDDNPVWLKKIFTADNGDKVGYLCYYSFKTYYDQQLMDAFREFKSAGVKELILDLRYNMGGNLLSSAVMGTMIAGEAKKDQVFTTLIYNKTRTDAGATDNKCLIGNKADNNYQLIADAIGSDYALGLKRIYMLCTEETGSASELIINGMRGLDIDVHLIGTTTNGKNVGMEKIYTTEMGDGYEYEFAPITFYTANAKGFKDYSSGFEPDVVMDEASYLPSPWGDLGDPLLFMAMKWINNGVKPSVSASLQTVRARSEKHRKSKMIKCESSLEGIILPPPTDRAQ